LNGVSYPGLMLDWDDLRYFLAVARHGSLSAAARRLEVAQPTVGRRLASLERQLGARLIVPTPTGQTLSPTGQRMLAHAEQMERDALAAEHIAFGRDAGLSGPVRVTASEWMIESVLAPLVAPFLVEHPRLCLELLADPRHISLVRREADLALRPSEFEQPEIVQRRVGSISFGLYASDGYLARHGMPNFENLCSGHFLIAMSEHLTKVPDTDWLPRVAAHAHVVARCNGRLPMAALAAASVGITCLPRFIGDATHGLRRLSAPEQEPARTLWLGGHRDAGAVPRIRASVLFLKASLQRLQGALHPGSSVGDVGDDQGAAGDDPDAPALP